MNSDLDLSFQKTIESEIW